MNPNDTKLTDFELDELRIFEAVACKEILQSKDQKRIEAFHKLRVRLLMAIGQVRTELTINSN